MKTHLYALKCANPRVIPTEKATPLGEPALFCKPSPQILFSDSPFGS